jgi:hypothetical protein
MIRRMFPAEWGERGFFSGVRAAPTLSHPNPRPGPQQRPASAWPIKLLELRFSNLWTLWASAAGSGPVPMGLFLWLRQRRRTQLIGAPRCQKPFVRYKGVRTLSSFAPHRAMTVGRSCPIMANWVVDGLSLKATGVAHRMSLRRKIFLFGLGLITVLAVVAVNQPRGGAHILQIKYLQPAWRTLSADKPLRI